MEYVIRVILRFKMSFGLIISSTDSVSIERMKKLIPKRFKSCFENQKQIFFSERGQTRCQSYLISD